MKTTILDLEAYKLYYDYCTKNLYKVFDVPDFIKYKDDAYFQKFYKMALKKIRMEKIKDINNGTNND